ncbi:hypothetical protein [Sediminibacterium soli]|uniref:hypothetical protein n=1 Tax=Sediminibacterium soli TaxID=2698829 RepID=UPI00137AE861|nr:hypothetical protein [Sediminibacterium soli]NCI46881.1 hypothetical protein [Sediminibacterium soli]
MNAHFFQTIRPLLALFILFTVLCVVFSGRLQGAGIDAQVVIVTNLLLFVITAANLYLLNRNIAKANPNAVIRGMMAGSLLKLLLLAAAFFIYLIVVREKRNAPAIYIGMGLYSLYTWIEVRTALRMNRKK